jgi:hypothetical protein
MESIIFYGNPTGERELPNGRVLKLEVLPDFDKLEFNQQAWVAFYVDNYPSKAMACIESGTTRGQLKRWLDESEIFFELVSMIDDLMKETLSGVHFEAAKEDPVVRGHVLKALGADGYKKEPTEHKHLHLGQGADLHSLMNRLGSKKS